ncbi:MAG: hypothetical protein J6B91_01235 [Prevotella sp.]|nr:hypothetical protein [Prevotella sp.]
MKSIYHVLMTVVLLSAFSCGQQHKAESIVKDFMEVNMLNGKKPTDIVFHDIDSTRYITDSLVYVMRDILKQSDRYKKDIAYVPGNIERNLKVIRVEYKSNGKNCSDSYYMDNDITRVISLKSNQ